MRYRCNRPEPHTSIHMYNTTLNTQQKKIAKPCLLQPNSPHPWHSSIRDRAPQAGVEGTSSQRGPAATVQSIFDITPRGQIKIAAWHPANRWPFVHEATSHCVLTTARFVPVIRRAAHASLIRGLTGQGSRAPLVRETERKERKTPTAGARDPFILPIHLPI